MAVCRFGWDDSDVYVYRDVNGGICCCGCSLQNGATLLFKTEQEMLAHLRKHKAAGDSVPQSAFEELAEASH